MEQNKSDYAKEMLEKEIDNIADCEKKERMKYFLSEYSKPKFNINGPVYVFFITILICFFWQDYKQKAYIEEQQQEINSLILYIIYSNPEMFPNDSIILDSSPYNFEFEDIENVRETFI